METAAGATQHTIHYALNSAIGSAASSSGTKTVNAYIDVFKDLSLVNHRLYRQGRVPMVRFGFRSPLGAAVTSAAVLGWTLPNNWQVRKAHQFALKQYLKATRETRRATGQARWHDFKVYYEDAMRTGTTLSPIGITTGNAEWNYSQVSNDPSSNSSVDRQFKFIGSTDSDCWGMIAEYDSKADTDSDDPENPGSSAPYNSLHPEISTQQMDHMLDEGDFPPYNPDALQVQPIVSSAAQGFGKSDQLMSPWVPAPCGLIKILGLGTYGATLDDDTAGLFCVEVMAGDYKGIHATPMGLKL